MPRSDGKKLKVLSMVAERIGMSRKQGMNRGEWERRESRTAERIW
jgi:hypothetical protein